MCSVCIYGTLNTPDLLDASWVAYAEVFPVGEVIDNPIGGGHAELVNMEDATLWHQPWLNTKASISSSIKVSFCESVSNRVLVTFKQLSSVLFIFEPIQLFHLNLANKRDDSIFFCH